MSATLLFLHGVGERPTVAWQPLLNDALERLGFRRLVETDVIEPDYRALLRAEHVDRVVLPAPHPVDKSTSEARRAVYEQNQSSLRRLLDVNNYNPRPTEYPADLADFTAQVATSVNNDLRQARRYCAEEPRRSAVLGAVLDAIGRADDLVIVGHSLGSLVALDLLPYLPEQNRVRRLITIGSPVGIPWMHARTARLQATFPYGRVGSWLNVVSTRDLVTAQRGAVRMFPAATDLIITPRIKDTVSTRHGAADYLREDGPAMALGESMFGVPGELARVEVSIEVRPTAQEYVALFGLAYAHLIADKLPAINESAAKRYAAALAVVQPEIHRRLAVAAHEAGRTLSQVVDNLKSPQIPAVPRAWANDLNGALRLLVITATTNLVQPYEIETAKASLDVMGAASAGLGFGAHHGETVRDAIVEARKCLDSSWFTWQRMLIGAAGVAVLATGPIGLMLAAPAGLAGGAAIVSALAAFGPGGMVGGMALAGALVSSGAVATTAALLVDQAPAVLELEIVRRMAHALARKRLDLDPDPTDWGLIVATARELDVQIQDLGAFSDTNSETLKAAKVKLEMVSKALAWMAERGLTPGQIQG